MTIEVDNKDCCNPHQVVSGFYDKILGFVINKVNDKEVAQDITQEVMGRMIDAYNKKLPIKNVGAWLFKVTRNIIADRYRKNNTHNYVETQIESVTAYDESMITAEDFIIPMIKLLPDEYRIPLYMSDIENIKQSEIAQKMNLSLSATKMRCQRARKKLHELFLECCDIQYTENGSFAYCTLKKTCDILLKEEEKMNYK